MAHGIDKQVLRLQIAMENAVLMQVDECLQNLIEEALRLFFRQRLLALVTHVLLQVELEVFENEVQLILTVNHFFQFDDVGVLYSFKKRNFTNCG